MKVRLGLIPCLIPLLVACGGTGAPSAALSTTTASTAVASKPTASANASAAAIVPSGKPAGSAASAAASGKPAASPAPNPTYTDGTVKSLDQGKLTLVDGKSLIIGSNTTFSKLQKETPADIKPGQFAAITGKLQDGKLLASFVRLQDSSGGRPASQSPMEAFSEGQPVTGNLMTNAPVKQASADGMVVTLPGGDVTVQYVPGVQIMHQVDGSSADAQPGRKVFVIHRGDTAANVSVYA